MPEGWDREFLSLQWMKPQVDAWVAEFFDRELDDIGNTLDLDLIRIGRHIAQKQAKPQFYSFEERDKYDLNGIARKRLRNNSLENDEFLQQDFGRAGNLWKIFYKSYEHLPQLLTVQRSPNLRNGTRPGRADVRKAASISECDHPGWT